jgi:pentose-5-phosphate-3-epimerase/CBS domain-containing protein
MKISASIYSNKNSSLENTIKSLHDNGADMFHVDCNDDLNVFEDFKIIRKLSNKPIDLHVITSSPKKYFSYIEKEKPEYVTFQFEDVVGEINLPNIKTKYGLAITSQTSVSVFEKYADKFSFILIMATTPGKSGGTFNKENFEKIRVFKKLYPDKAVHVDGGVNAEVSFILRNMGVDVAVSGSYLFNETPVGTALLNLKVNETHSQFYVKDFMHGINEIPLLYKNKCNLKDILESIEKGKMGFTILAEEDKKLVGLISNADVRKGLLKHIDNLNNVGVNDVVNTQPVTINENATVKEMLNFIRKKKFPISYMPVVNNAGEVAGAITFFNLIKGEL